jgi:hypothetical protein
MRFPKPALYALFVILTSSLTTFSSAQRIRPCCSTPPTDPMPYWTWSSNGNTIRMVGNDPRDTTKGPSSPLYFSWIPIIFRFPDGRTVDPTAPTCGNVNSASTLALNSPIFQSYSFVKHDNSTNSDISVGTTYLDAYQRANLWTLISTQRPDYHIFFNYMHSVPAQIIDVTAADYASISGSGCSATAFVNISLLQGKILDMLRNLNLPTNSVPIFLTFNTFFPEIQLGTDHVDAGWHGVFNTSTGVSQPYVVATFIENTQAFGIDPVFANTYHLSHEVVEWLIDPFSNAAPYWKSLPSPIDPNFIKCSNKLEVADPMYGIVVSPPAVLNGYSYNLADLAFIPWFTREQVSTSFNNWYTFMNTSPTFSSPNDSTCP